MATNNKAVISATIAGIIASVVYIEGGFVNDPDDPGGATKYGITERVAREYGYTGAMEDLTKEEADQIYSTLYVLEPGFDKMVEINPAVAHKLIDAGVNVGTARVSLWFQKALNSYSRGGSDYPQIPEDGILGERTITSYKLLEQVRGKEKACQLMLKALDGQQLSYYFSLKLYSKFMIGWVDKRIQNIPLNQCSEYNLVVPLENNLDESL